MLAETTVAAVEQALSKTPKQRQEALTRPAALLSASVSRVFDRALRYGVKANVPCPSRSDMTLPVSPFAHFVAETPLTVMTDLSPAHYA